jgi:DNA-binding beta-propeller fold protein YncE
MDPLTGDLWVTDWNNHCYRAISPDGIITRVVGNGRHGDDFDGAALEITSNHPGSSVVGPDGNFYLAIWHNWKIKLVDRITRYTTSIVGTDAGFGGDGGPGYLANLFLPSSVVFDHEGNMFISDQGNGRVRMVNKAGIIETLAGRQIPGDRDGFGYLASFSWSRGNDAYPGGRLAIDPAGENLYVADQLNNKVRKILIADHMVSTVAGTGTAGYSGDGGPAMDAELNYPCDVVCAPNGDVYVADTRNHAVRKIDASGVMTTVAGTGVAGVSPDGTLATEAMLNYVTGLEFNASTNTLYIADTYNSQVKKLIIPE